MVILDVKGLTLRRDGRTLVNDVGFALNAGEVLVLVGPNGAGKSSLLKLLAGEWRANSGHVLVHGKRLAEWPPSALALLRAVLPQHSSLTFPFTVREVVGFGRMPHDTGRVEDARIIDQLLQDCDVVPLADAPYTQLSGGEKQRVHWARVLAQVWEAETPLLLMDEPTSALDLAHQQSLMQVLRARASRGLGTVVAVHDLNLAARFADRILMMKVGCIAALGVPAEVLTKTTIQTVFGVDVTVMQHPAGGYPLVVA